MTDEHALISRALWANLDASQTSAMMETEACFEIDPEFCGFVRIYKSLADCIPCHWTIVDLGCAYAPQSWYFRNHAAYIGVDASIGLRFSQANTQHLNLKISEFIAQESNGLDLDTTFAICSYVPPWGGDNGAMVRAKFPNCFVFYPASGQRVCMP